MARTFTLNFPSTAFFPGGLSTAGPTFKNHGTGAYNRVSVAFDGASTENAVTGMFVMPAEYVGDSSTHKLKADICYYTNNTSSTNNNIQILASIEGIADGATTDLQAAQSFDDSPSPDVVTIPTVQGSLDIHTYDLTTEGADDGIAAGNMARLAIVRLGGADGYGNDMFLASVSLYEETV